MIKVSSSDVYGASNRPIAVQNFAGGQVASVSPAGLKPFTPSGLKPVDKVEGLPSSKADNAALEDAVKKLNAFIAPALQSVQFAVDKESNRTVVKVVDSETKQVLRQFPNEEALAMSRSLDKLQGLMVKQTA